MASPTMIFHSHSRAPRGNSISAGVRAYLTELGPGEREAIALALETNANFLLIDETDGRRTAVQNGVPVKGTLGMLEEAAKAPTCWFPWNYRQAIEA
ncbi:MAG: hypothetical protein WCT12_27070, partial [Verrucomicrobiota bacterium]